MDEAAATGAVLSGIALGLQQIFEPKRELPAFVMEAPGAPHDPDAPFTLHFDPDDPTKTVAVIRTPTADTSDADPHPGRPDHRTVPDAHGGGAQAIVRVPEGGPVPAVPSTHPFSTASAARGRSPRGSCGRGSARR